MVADTLAPGGVRNALIKPDDPRLELAFPKLTPKQIKGLEPFGKQFHANKDSVIWQAGATDLCMYVVVTGELNILDGRTGNCIATHTEGSFTGDIDILDGRASVVTAVAGTDVDLRKIPADCVRKIVADRPDLGEVILRAFLMRRSLMMEAQVTGPLVVGSRFSADTLRIREFLTRNHYPVVWEDLESNPQTTKVLEEFQVTIDDTPVVVLPTGEVLRRPSNEELARVIGIRRPIEPKLYDLVIVGGGPAGLAAAVYGASEGLTTIVVDAHGPGGQARNSSMIENYMGFPLGISGQALADAGLVQAEKFGARMIVPADAVSIRCNSVAGHKVDAQGIDQLTCRCIILAPGAQYRRLGLEGQEKFEGRGIYYAATHTEKVLCAGSQVAVVGGGNSAGQAAVYLSEHSSKVFLIVRGELRDSMSHYLARRIEQSDKITVLLHSEVGDLVGDEHLEEITIVNRDTGERHNERVAGLFVMIGASPHTRWLPDAILRDDKGFIMTGPSLLQQNRWEIDRAPFFLETSCPGIFAAGDARSTSVKRVASAVGEGAMAVALVHQFLST